MKRIVLSVLGTVLGLVALLSFKAHGHTVGATSALPSAALPSAASTAPAAAPASTATSAPPNPSSGAAAGAAGAAGRAPSSSAAARSSAAATSRTVDGSAVQTRYGTVQVRVTLAGSKITNVEFLQLTSFDQRSADINSQAGPLLLQETLTAQNAGIDMISGATYTSEGYLQSLQSALDQAGVK